MRKPIFTGCGVALVTPFNKSGDIDYDELKRLIEAHIQCRTSAVIICGTTGESPALSKSEKEKLITKAIEFAAGRIPVIAGTGSNNFLSAISLSKYAANAGADGLLVITPYYNKTTESGIIEYYSAISDAVDIPIIMYDVPSRTGIEIPVSAYRELSKIKNIVGVKDAKGDLAKIIDIKRICGDNFYIYSGCDELTLPYLSCGASGVISVAANIMPKLMNKVCQDKALEDQIIISEISKALFCEVNPMPIKAIMDLLGYNTGKCRAPLTEMKADNIIKLKRIIEKYNIKAIE